MLPVRRAVASAGAMRRGGLATTSSSVAAVSLGRVGSAPRSTRSSAGVRRREWGRHATVPGTDGRRSGPFGDGDAGA